LIGFERGLTQVSVTYTLPNAAITDPLNRGIESSNYAGATGTVCRIRGSDIMETKKPEFDAIVINEAQLILAEKRTSLASIRTGIAVIALPLSLVGLLIATSKFYDVSHVLHWLIPLTILNAVLVCLGAYLIVRSLVRIHRYDRLMNEIKRKHSAVAEFLD